MSGRDVAKAKLKIDRPRSSSKFHSCTGGAAAADHVGMRYASG